MKSYLLAAGILVYTFTAAPAQELMVQPATPRIDLQVSFGAGTGQFTYFSLSELRTFFPESSLLRDTTIGFLNNYFSPATDYASFSFSAGIFGRNPSWLNPAHALNWRLGIHHNSLSRMEYSSYLYDRVYRIDTLFDANGNPEKFVDSTVYKSTSVVFNSSRLAAEGMMLIRFNELKRWSVYVGLGLNAGITYNNEMVLNGYEDFARIIFDPVTQMTSSLPSPGSNGVRAKDEVYRLKSSFSVMGFIPFGIDFRFSRHNPDGLVHLFAEGRVGLAYFNYPRLKSLAGSFIDAGMGIRLML